MNNQHLSIIKITMVWLCVFSTYLQINAQDFFNLNDGWIYRQNHGTDTVQLRVVGEVEINGQLYKSINGKCNCGIIDNIYLTQQNKKVYFYNEVLNTTTLLYDFDLSANDSYQIKLNQHIEIDIYIDSVSVLNSNSRDFNVQHISYNRELIDFGDIIIEGVGSDLCLVPMGSICDPQTGPLMCFYSDNELFFNLDSHSCDNTLTSSSFNHLLPGSVNIYPNPASNTLNISGINASSSLEIFDLSGNSVLKLDAANEKLRLDLSLLNRGIHFVKIYSGDNQFVITKLILI